MNKAKWWLLVLCGILIVTVTSAGTLSYLTDQTSVVNTFTVGHVDIQLNETAVTPDGTPIDGAERVAGNDYHLIPGQTYVKDPTLTVVKGSDESYVRLLVTINHYSALQTIFEGAFLPENFVSGWESAVWISTQMTVDADTATYEFRYHTTVEAKEADRVLEPLFETITVPGGMTAEQLAALSGLEITVVGHAIQAAGFENADAAWAAFSGPING